MRIDLVIPTTWDDPIRSVRELPVMAEDWGFDGLWITDHVVGVTAYQGVYGMEWAEALTSLSFAAARTSRIRLGIGVLVVPYRNPVYAAKVLATLDQLSGGRLDFGVGTGWSRSEYRALGVPDASFEARGRLTNESLDLMLRCWEGGTFGWGSENFEFREITFLPTPAQRPHPPIWAGGNSGAALRRTARYADVWHPLAPPYPGGVPASSMQDQAQALDAQAGRTIKRSIRIKVQDKDLESLPEVLQEYADAGCEQAAIEFDLGGYSLTRRAGEKLAKLVLHNRPSVATASTSDRPERQVVSPDLL
jgi:probable F420-dependent oxidoreductase